MLAFYSLAYNIFLLPHKPGHLISTPPWGPSPQTLWLLPLTCGALCVLLCLFLHTVDISWDAWLATLSTWWGTPGYGSNGTICVTLCLWVATTGSQDTWSLVKKKVNREGFERHPFVCISGRDAGTPQMTGRNRHLKPGQGVKTGQQVTDTQVSQHSIYCII